MHKSEHISKRHFYMLATIAALIIFTASLEALFKVKDVDFFIAFKEGAMDAGVSKEQLINMFLTSILAVYFIKISIPMLISVTAFLTIKRINYNAIITYLWFVLILGGFFYTAIERAFNSLFYYVTLILYLVYLGFVLYSKVD